MNTDKIEDKIMDLFPEWERVVINVITSPIEMTSQFSFAEQQRSTIELMEDESNLFIVDSFHFDILGEQRLLKSFDTMESFLVENVDYTRLFYLDMEQEQGEKLLGIDITNHDFLSNTEVTAVNDNKLAIHSRSEDTGNALQFVEIFID
ncbi:hypothetical protein J2S74_005542 [Evansella vedderi]|uniref:Uncharacterized protein n=1 Tax=Evansella vedderi TaxID=38282 RepID=A0ABU0A3K5_9BACI|nr:hypothetical protein [Evansella vedderi]MDQ0258078.1 hypothetical protein [Evansella vedderi]